MKCFHFDMISEAEPDVQAIVSSILAARRLTQAHLNLLRYLKKACNEFAHTKDGFVAHARLAVGIDDVDAVQDNPADNVDAINDLALIDDLFNALAYYSPVPPGPMDPWQILEPTWKPSVVKSPVVSNDI